MIRTLRARVTVASVVIASVALGLGAWLFSRAATSALYGRLDRDLTAEAQAIADAPDASTRTNLVAVVAPDRLVQVRDAERALVASSRNHVRQSADLRHLEVSTDARRPRGPGWVSGRDDLTRLGRGWRTAVVDGSRHEVTMAAPVADLAGAVGTVTAVTVASIPVVLGLTAAIVWLALGRLLRPVDRMRQHADRAVTVYPPPELEFAGAGAEIERLGTTLNDLLARTAAGVRTQRRFLANAAHELLSPLTTLRTTLEVAGRRPDAEPLRPMLDRCMDSQGRLEALAGQLLDLARAEADEAPHVTEVDLGTLIDGVVDDVRGATHAGISVDVDVSGATLMLGDPTGLRQLVDNLVRNAAQHARARVAVEVRGSLDTIRIHVEDDGPGVPDNRRDDVFEPFVRLDEERDRSRGGAGLGLAIVRSVATRHGGTTQVTDSPLGGARFLVTLPRRGTELGLAAPT